MILFYIITGIFCIILIFILIFKISVHIRPPSFPDKSVTNLKINIINATSYQCGKGWLRKNRNHIWEMYLEGEPLERGITTGKLTNKLLEWQEHVFIDEIHRMVPNRFYLFFLKNLVQWLNRKLNRHISEELNLEIYGISLSASDKFNSIGTPYKRLLNYHAAHDIGHALQDMKYVGCTSFSAWGENSADGKIITGRNFDFYINDDFGKEKILAFVKPSTGLKFAMVTWAGMTGAVSGMNEKGLAITINAAKSSFRFKVATPISILIREMLQYAGNIEEALRIAEKTNVFVSELILVSSASDNKAVIIEKTPSGTELFESHENRIICTNHCQSEGLINDKLNTAYMEESASVYRFERVKELLNLYSPLDTQKAAAILHNKEGKEGQNIGLGNEKSINQLLAHHGIIFQPDKKIIYLSSPPYNMGEFMAYRLDEIFDLAEKGCPDSDIDDKHLTIKKDCFAESGNLNRYLEYKEFIRQLNTKKLNHEEANHIFHKLTGLNPEYFLTYVTIGNYLKKSKRYKDALEWYNKALEKEVPTKTEKKNIHHSVNFCKSRI